MGLEKRLLCPIANKDQNSSVYMVPSAGTTPMSLMRLARSLDSSLRVCAFAYGGLDNDFPIQRDIDEIAAVCVEEILSDQPDGPYKLLGYCLGGIVAYEIARQLEERGKSVDSLVVIEAFAPLLGDDQWGVEDHEDMEAALRPIFEKARQQLAAIPSDISRQIINIMTMHFDAGARYSTKPIKSDLYVIRTESHSVSLYDGWKKCTPACHDYVLISGDTASILLPPDVKGLADAVNSALLSK